MMMSLFVAALQAELGEVSDIEYDTDDTEYVTKSVDEPKESATMAYLQDIGETAAIQLFVLYYWVKQMVAGDHD